MSDEERPRRNPPWSRDELILALDLYMRVGRQWLPPADDRVIALSERLGALAQRSGAATQATFRNPNGVGMKLGNFLAIDPEYEGAGLAAGGRGDRLVWDEYAEDPERLRAAAAAIEAAIDQVPASGDAEDDPDDAAAVEGGILLRLHRRRERDPSLAKKKKASVLKTTGRLACEACGFDAEAVYGEAGRGFAECHHRAALASLPSTTRTTLRDLAILCANCHRIIHRIDPMPSVEDFAADLAARRG